MNYHPFNAADDLADEKNTSTIKPAPHVIPVGVPPGLERLLDLSYLRVHEHNKFIEACFLLCRGKRYSVFDRSGKTCYVVGPKEPFCCDEACCGCSCGCSCAFCPCKTRDFNMYVWDENRSRMVINAYHQLSCCKSICGVDCRLPCSTKNEILNVEAPAGTCIGRIRYRDPCCSTSKFFLEDPQGNTQLFINVDCCMLELCTCRSWSIDIYDASRSTKVGEIKRNFPGCYKCFCFHSSEFELSFPQDLDAKAKALLLIAPFFIDWMYYNGKRLLQTTADMANA